jgi:hypothetical protein
LQRDRSVSHFHYNYQYINISLVLYAVSAMFFGILPIFIVICKYCRFGCIVEPVIFFRTAAFLAVSDAAVAAPFPFRLPSLIRIARHHRASQEKLL